MAMLVLSETGCASLMNGTRQDVAISSLPADAECRISEPDQQVIKTPAVIPLKRTRKHSIVCQLPGYQPARAVLDLRTSSWLWGDLVCLPPIGLLIDAASGAANKIVPGQVLLTLQPAARQDGMDSAAAYGQMLAQYAARRGDAANFHKQLSGAEQAGLESYVLANKGKDSGLALRFIIDSRLPAQEQEFVSWFLQSFTDRTPVKPGLESRPFTDWMKP
jgi:hypothetical protein